MTNEPDDRPDAGNGEGGGKPETEPRTEGRQPEGGGESYYADDYASRRWKGDPQEAARKSSTERYAEHAEHRESFADFPGWRGPKYGNPHGPGRRRFDYSPTEHRPAGQAPGHVSRSDRNRERELLPSQPGRAAGSHRGKGPRGYRRSDARIHEDVCESLMEDEFLDASRIEVAVDAGEVTLSGYVEDKWSKRTAEDDADGVRGVRHVQNNLRIEANLFS